jgi:hypothetical protein
VLYFWSRQTTQRSGVSPSLLVPPPVTGLALLAAASTTLFSANCRRLLSRVSSILFRIYSITGFEIRITPRTVKPMEAYLNLLPKERDLLEFFSIIVFEEKNRQKQRKETTLTNLPI